MRPGLVSWQVKSGYLTSYSCFASICQVICLENGNFQRGLLFFSCLSVIAFLWISCCMLFSVLVRRRLECVPQNLDWSLPAAGAFPHTDVLLHYPIWSNVGLAKYN